MKHRWQRDYTSLFIRKKILKKRTVGLHVCLLKPDFILLQIYTSAIGSWSISTEKCRKANIKVWFVATEPYLFGHFIQDVPDYVSELVSLDLLESKPLNGLRIGIIQETLGEGVDTGVISSIKDAASHLEHLGSVVEEVWYFTLSYPKYIIIKKYIF